jgi:thiol-disulfide isomerase/thioredoxin
MALSACAKTTDNPGTRSDSSSQETSGGPTVGKEGDSSDTSKNEESNNDEMMEPTSEEMMKDDHEAMAENQEPMEDTVVSDTSMLPNWFFVSLTDVNSGEAFKVGDFKGKVVLVETMAMWCSTCLRQQKEVLRLHEFLGDSDDFISLTLDIDPNEIAKDLETYSQNYGFYWTYAVSPHEVAREIADLYGDSFLNPPSAPMFVIDVNGEVHPLRFGVKNADELLETLQSFLEEVM